MRNMKWKDQINNHDEICEKATYTYSKYHLGLFIITAIILFTYLLTIIIIKFTNKNTFSIYSE